MLSIGIRCGQGFDKNTLAALIETGKRPYEYDVLIMGTNPGGVACAKEARNCGRKIALVCWRIPTPGEEEGHDEDKYQMMEALQMDKRSIQERTYSMLEEENKAELMPAIKFSPFTSSKVSQVELRNDQKHSKWCRKIRRSRIDFKNAITNMALEGIRYMHEVAMTRDFSSVRNNPAKPLPITWGKMMEKLLDHVIEKRWNILTDFLQDKINIYNGRPIFLEENAVRIVETNGAERVITAEKIVTAVEVHHSFPADVVGSREFGINLDDFFRLSLSPGKTLVVGGNRLGLSCAGILASFGFPVVVAYRSTLLRGGDNEIVDMIVRDLQNLGVKFMEKKSLICIQKNKTGEALLAEFVPAQPSALTIKKKYSEEFDTVLFATTEKLNVKKSAFQTEYERLSGKACSAEVKQTLRNFVNIPDKPGNEAAAELVGKHIGQQLFGTEESPPNLSLVPNVTMTPIEYAYVGTSEVIARTRLGEECIEVYKGYFQTEDVISDKNSLKSEICFAKIVSVRDMQLIVGLHLFGRDAIQIMGKILEPVKEKITVDNLHTAIRNLMKSEEYGGEGEE